MAYSVVAIVLVNILLALKYVQSQSAFTKSVTLTPDNVIKSGANLTQLSYNFIYPYPTFWNIYTSTQSGYALRVSLDDSWGFHSNYSSSIEILIDGHMVLYDGNLCISFSVNKAHFVSLYTRLDNNNDNRIYPNCTQSHRVPIGEGDIQEFVSRNNGMERAQKLLYNTSSDTVGGNQYGYEMLPPDPSTNHHDIGYTLIYKLTNDPMQDTLNVSFTNSNWQTQDNNYTQHCLYSSFQPEYGLNIYIAGDKNDHGLAISSITIKYYYQIADDPTNNPTQQPSKSSSAHPTNEATNIPTNAPTIVPINAPTNIPTNVPTNHPTYLPSSSPSNSPAAPTTRKPTLNGITTPVPTTMDTASPTFTPSISPTEAMGKKPKTSKDGHNASLIAIITILLFVCVCLIAAYKRSKRRKMRKESKISNVNDYIELMDMEQDDKIEHQIEGDSETERNSIANTLYNTISTTGEDNNDEYEYSAPILENMMEGNDDNANIVDIDMEYDQDNDSDADSDFVGDLIAAEKNTANDFEQILGDQCVSSDLIMDDIINDMETDK